MLQWSQEKFIRITKIAMLTIVFSLAIFSFPNKAAAQSATGSADRLQTGIEVIEEPLGLPATDIRLVIARIIRVALGLLGIVVLLLVLYAGFLWMTAGGNEEQIATAKKFLLNAVIGLAIILSAYAIVSFVINRLVDATSGNNFSAVGGNLEAPIFTNFEGSGALGQIIKDHYPSRDQAGVPRNARIVVTFRQPVKMDSIVDDTTGDGIFGNCRTTVENWYDDCDRLKNLSDSLINIKPVGSGQVLSGAVVLGAESTVNNITGVYTIVIKPITDPTNPAGGYLGSPTEPVRYVVRLGSGLLLDDAVNNNPSVFRSGVLGSNYYEWEFSNSTGLDIIPPTVESIFPDRNSAEDKNSIIQINFSEPVDPIGLTGQFNAQGNHYYVDGQNIYLRSDNSTIPQGSFNLVNGYRTLEFAPSRICGQNACGNPIFCLPVCDKNGANCTEDEYEVILKAARTMNPNSFEAQPFSGVVDLAGNALDGNRNGIANSATTTLPVFPGQKQPDNYFWNFTLVDRVDDTAPYIRSITPGIDAENITRDQELSMVFSERMRADSMYNIGIEEQPAHSVPIWRVPSTRFNSDGTTYTRLGHGPFLDGSRQYYFTVVSSTVEDVHFNCFYPGKGPRYTVFPNTTISPECSESNSQNCCQVVTAQNNSFCCNGAVGASIPACLNYLRQNSL